MCFYISPVQQISPFSYGACASRTARSISPNWSDDNTDDSLFIHASENQANHCHRRPEHERPAQEPSSGTVHRRRRFLRVQTATRIQSRLVREPRRASVSLGTIQQDLLWLWLAG